MAWCVGAHEIVRVRAASGAASWWLPGIRPAGGELGDQKRVMLRSRRKAGANILVIGRPITAAPDPARRPGRSPPTLAH